MAKREDSNDARRHTDAARRQSGSGGGGSGGGSDRSPMHAQVRSHRTSSSPAWEKKVSAESGPNFAPSTPGRSRLSTGRGNSKPDDPAEKGPQLPKFGQWDTNDPSSADGFTVIFNKARDEKRSGGAVQRTQSSENQLNKTHLSSSNKKWFCCFGSTPAES